MINAFAFGSQTVRHHSNILLHYASPLPYIYAAYASPAYYARAARFACLRAYYYHRRATCLPPLPACNTLSHRRTVDLYAGMLPVRCYSAALLYAICVAGVCWRGGPDTPYPCRQRRCVCRVGRAVLLMAVALMRLGRHHI